MSDIKLCDCCHRIVADYHSKSGEYLCDECASVLKTTRLFVHDQRCTFCHTKILYDPYICRDSCNTVDSLELFCSEECCLKSQGYLPVGDEDDEE